VPDVGQGVKVYVAPDFGRQDAVVVAVYADDVIDARAVKSGELIQSVVPAIRGDDVLSYWAPLPEDFIPGSEGH